MILWQHPQVYKGSLKHLRKYYPRIKRGAIVTCKDRRCQIVSAFAQTLKLRDLEDDWQFWALPSEISFPPAEQPEGK